MIGTLSETIRAHGIILERSRSMDFWNGGAKGILRAAAMSVRRLYKTYDMICRGGWERRGVCVKVFSSHERRSKGLDLP